MRDAFIATLTELAAADPSILLITGDLGFGVLTEFARRFPKQFVNAGVAEQMMTGLAAGLALEGHTVFTYSIGNFPTLRCLEQVRSDICYHRANVKIVAVGGGFSYGALGVSHHATEDLAILRSLPEMTVAAPCDLWETEALTRYAVTTPGPMYLRLDKSKAPPTHRPGETFNFGKARRVREGTEATLLATGGILGEAINAADALATEGIECRVLSLPVVQPFDGDEIETAARETGGIITIEEHGVRGGLGGAVSEHLLERGRIPGFFRRVGIRSGYPQRVGSQAYLRTFCGLDAAAIASLVRGLVRNRNQTARP